MITRDFGKPIAQEVTGAHEGDMNNFAESFANLPSFTGIETLEAADSVADQYNNLIGMTIGQNALESPEFGSNQSIVQGALALFRILGLATVQEQENGTFNVIITNIGHQQFVETRDEFGRRDENGFSPDYVPPQRPCMQACQ